MPRLPKRPGTARRKVHRLQSGSAALWGGAGSLAGPAAEPMPGARPRLVVPTRVLNTVIALFLLPLAAVWSKTFFYVFARETLRHDYWATEEFWFFALGALLWIVAFFGLPRRAVNYAYVYGHELTHAIWVWLMGGRVSAFEVRRDGGHIMTNKSNVWIALSPYFYPIYSVAVIILYALGWLLWDMAPYTRWLFLALGITWTFHMSFTLWMIPKGQSDLARHGTFFSLVLIYLMNLAVITALVLLTAPCVTVRGFGREFLHNAVELSSWIAAHLRR
ncbi:MAG: hypothetical protein WCH57_07405 [Verrucomicrobiota bacterium]